MRASVAPTPLRLAARTITAVAATIAALAVPLVLPAQSRAYTFVDIPGAVNTYATVLEPDGRIFGSYDIDAMRSNAFVRDPDGTITSFSVPGAPVTFVLGSAPNGGVIGFYGDDFGLRHGYIRDAAGAFSFFDVPGAFYTIPYSSDASGRIVGAAAAPNGFVQGFIRDPAGNVTTFAVPGVLQTFAFSITDAGDIYGTSGNVISGNQGFRRDPLGNLTPFDILPGVTGTYPFRVSLDGTQMVGSYEDATGATHGFMLHADGTVETIDVLPNVETNILDFNARGDLVGYYDDIDTRTFHAFVGIATPEPTAFALAVPGLLLVGFTTRRTRRRASRS